jgi:hypothetical protein
MAVSTHHLPHCYRWPLPCVRVDAFGWAVRTSKGDPSLSPMTAKLIPPPITKTWAKSHRRHCCRQGAPRWPAATPHQPPHRWAKWEWAPSSLLSIRFSLAETPRAHRISFSPHLDQQYNNRLLSKSAAAGEIHCFLSPLRASLYGGTPLWLVFPPFRSTSRLSTAPSSATTTRPSSTASWGHSPFLPLWLGASPRSYEAHKAPRAPPHPLHGARASAELLSLPPLAASLLR